MLVFAAILGCLSPVLTVAATISSRSPFVSPLERREAADAAKRGFAREQSDHLAVLAAYEGWRDARADGRRGASARAGPLHARLAMGQPALARLAGPHHCVHKAPLLRCFAAKGAVIVTTRGC